MALYPLFAAGALLPLFTAYPIAVAQDGTAQAGSLDIVAITPDLQARMTVPVHIGVENAQTGSKRAGPYRFMIDTGAERTILSRDIARQLGLASAGQALLVGVAGTQEVDLVEVEEINLGRRSFYGLTAPLLDGRWIGADGIIGLDSLQDQRVLLDFDKKVMAIGDARQLGGNSGFEITVQARRRSGQLIMTNAMVDGVRTDIIIDTGSDTSIGNPPLQRALARRHAQEQTSLISVTGQSISADVGLARTLVLGGLTMSNTPLVFADAPPFKALKLDKRPAMLLGMDQLRLFRRVAIDFSSRSILFDMPRGLPMQFGMN
ncbi:retroviral-like aspartic protease family protein [Novosphingobium sp.]|uniref:retroviral-like aspartic protease family protein n=1 Tax=Novosphingobium sp. TaxID=1874826 RepID=UPI00352A8532